jgi:hypothetical protein
MRCVPVGPFSIRRVPVGPILTHLIRLQFIIKVFAPSFLPPTCTYRTLLHPISGTRQLTCHVYLWNRSPSPSDLWDPTVCVSCVPMEPSNLWDPAAYVSCVHGTFLHLHPTCGTQWLPCHLLLPGFNKFNLKKP